MIADRDCVLQMCHGVKHLHGRYVPVFLQKLTGPAREPVVCMNDVVAGSFTQCEECHITDEIGQVAEQFVFGDRMGRTGLDIYQSESIIEFNNLRQGAIVASGKDVYADPVTYEPLTQLTDVDVHSPGISTAELCDW
jgi:hypothetical protein